MDEYSALKILEIRKPFTIEQLKIQYKKIAIKEHPDISKKPDATKIMQDVNVAFDLLKKSASDSKSSFKWNSFDSSNFGSSTYTRNSRSESYDFNDDFFFKFKEGTINDLFKDLFENLFKEDARDKCDSCNGTGISETTYKLNICSCIKKIPKWLDPIPHSLKDKTIKGFFYGVNIEYCDCGRAIGCPICSGLGIKSSLKCPICDGHGIDIKIKKETSICMECSGTGFKKMRKK